MAVWLMLVLLALVLGLVGATTAAWWLVVVGAVLLLLGLLIRFRRSER
ncbi:MAG: LPXTG cell wall anchor domain-containing protein [Candidatus Nanopelagicales bacterium]